jgi:hypothetical protein
MNSAQGATVTSLACIPRKIKIMEYAFGKLLENAFIFLDSPEKIR